MIVLTAALTPDRGDRALIVVVAAIQVVHLKPRLRNLQIYTDLQAELGLMDPGQGMVEVVDHPKVQLPTRMELLQSLKLV